MKYYVQLLSFLLSATLVGCATQNDHYHWGNYETLVYSAYMQEEGVDPQQHINLLNEDIQTAESLGKPIPPGVHAHLGYMHYQAGDTEKAFQAFNREIILYPESEYFISGLLTRMAGS